MDVRYFLGERLAFIQQLYVNCCAPFVDRQRKIDAEEEPYIPLYNEDPDSPFLSEWLEAEDSIQVIGYTCVSMLSASFHLYLKSWEVELGVPVDAGYKSIFKNHGWFNGYKHYFRAQFGVIFEECPCDIGLLEELTLARNRVQHLETISNQYPRYSEQDLQKMPSPYFINDAQRSMVAAMAEGERDWLLPPVIHVTEEKIFAAISEIARFAKWLEETDH
ncbi:hypothetical protein [Lamprocystis purpurea]|uniref:hypothetical protein n=1 Tax=Lamprocystis purpurea TaxID=61598 RepID=UPI000381E08B|nr:hypothetical protein [Lamprocystis purpurea]